MSVELFLPCLVMLGGSCRSNIWSKNVDIRLHRREHIFHGG